MAKLLRSSFSELTTLSERKLRGWQSRGGWRWRSLAVRSRGKMRSCCNFSWLSNGIGCEHWCRHRDKIYLIRIFQAGVFCRSDWEKQKVNPKDRNEDKNNLCRLHHHVDVRVVPIEVVLKVQFCPRVASIDNIGQNDKTWWLWQHWRGKRCWREWRGWRARRESRHCCLGPSNKICSRKPFCNINESENWPNNTIWSVMETVMVDIRQIFTWPLKSEICVCVCLSVITSTFRI